MYCEKCNAILKGGAAFCGNCGCEINEVLSDNIENIIESDDRRYKRIIFRLVGVILVLIVLIVVIFATTIGKQNKIIKLLDLGDKYLDEMDYEQARVYYQQVIDISPKNLDAYEKISEVYLLMGNYEDAVEIMEEAYDKVDNKEAHRSLKEVEKVAEEMERLKLQEEAFEEFLNGERTVSYTSAMNPGKTEYYISEFINEQYFLDDVKYCYIYPEMGNEKKLVVKVSDNSAGPMDNTVYNGECYIIDYENGRLVVQDTYDAGYVHSEVILNRYGVVKINKEDVGYRYSTYYIDKEGTIRQIVNYTCKKIYNDGPMEYFFLEDKAEYIFEEVTREWYNNYNYDVNGIANLCIEEYYLEDGEVYYLPIDYVYDPNKLDNVLVSYTKNEMATIFIEMCKNRGMEFVAEEQIVELIEKRKLDIGDLAMFEDIEPEWILWN